MSYNEKICLAKQNKSKLEEALKQSISLLIQTTEFEVLESFKLKVVELQKVIEETKT